MNGFDVLLVLVLVLFAGLGVWRGLVREFVSFLTWIVAALAAWVFAGDVAGMFEEVTQEQPLQQMLAFVAIFVAVYIAGSLTGILLHKLVNRSAGLRLVNRIGGGALGLMRGAALVVIVFLLAGLTAFPQRTWWREAALVPTFERVATYAAQFLPQDVARHVRYG